MAHLLSEHPNQNCDTLTEIVPETNEQQFNHLLTDMVWDENAVVVIAESSRKSTLPAVARLESGN